MPQPILLGKNPDPPESTAHLLSPSHKRPRTSTWQPPPHIPGFLPPFPTVADTSPSPLVFSSQPAQFEIPPIQTLGAKSEKLPMPLAQHITSSSASDYLVQVPYSQSSLSGATDWHLPPVQPALELVTTRQPRPPAPQIEEALLTAYHHILTHPPSQNTHPPTPARHRVAMAILAQLQAAPRWEPPDTLYSSVAPCTPRVAAIGPTYPIAISDITSEPKAKTEKDFK
jgi:Wiskott-Aldrich syndrome protein